MAGFDLYETMQSVSNLDTEDQIVRIPLGKLLPDPRNFYSLEGVSDLADNIATIGLQQPLRVRPAEHGEFYIVSGHRRWTACLMIRDGGSQMFATGVPCIVEYGEASDALRELRLIFANSNTRVMSPADLSKQAERVEQLLYELKEQGMEFKGRMRDHVAAACNATKTKIGRLHAIRANLIPGWLEIFDRGDMVEDVAYNLSRLPQKLQEDALEMYQNQKKPRIPTGAVVRKVLEYLPRFETERPCPAHAGGPQCHHLSWLAARDLFEQYDWGVCGGTYCCMDCVRRDMCSKACKEAKDKTKLEKAVQKEKAAEQKAREEQLQKQRCKRMQKLAARILPAVEAAKLPDDAQLFDRYSSATVGEIREWAKGNINISGQGYKGEHSIVPTQTENLIQMAKLLNMSTDEILGLKFPEQPVSSAPSGWYHAGIPNNGGLYVCKFKLFAEDVQLGLFRYRDGGWKVGAEGKCDISRSCKILAYQQIIEEAE